MALFILTFLICQNAEFLSTYILMEPRCAPFLPIMGIPIPFATLRACINGYYYGTQKANVPMFEQIIRMVFIFLLADAWMVAGNQITVQLAVIGHLVGETALAIFTIFCLCFFPPHTRIHSKMPADRHSFNDRFIAVASPLLMLALPLMGNRLVLYILASAESIWIPSRTDLLPSGGIYNTSDKMFQPTTRLV